MPEKFTPKFTRKDYLAGRCDHATYYGQFVTDAVKRLVANAIGLDEIKASTDRAFNDIPLRKWDRLHMAVLNLAPRDETDTGWNALSVSCCIAKEAARQLKAS